MSADTVTQKTVTLEMTWEKGNLGERLFLGRVHYGSVLRHEDGHWVVLARSVPESDHPTREAAQAALEGAVLAMGVGLPSLALHPETPGYTHGMLIGDTRDARLEIERLRALVARLTSVAANLAAELSDPGTEALAAIHCGRR